ncbi:MAG: hypothetical protein K9N51_07800 [Candidatus Pacebacteria bacterium]|nr:hypothetical protein [Candidatus Paceibacterota bacterium]
MDVGRFKRGRWGLTPWVVTPLLLCVAVYVGVHIYCRNVEARLDKLRSVTAVLPEAETQLRLTREVIRDVMPSSADQAADMARLVTVVNSLAGQYAVDVLSLKNVSQKGDGKGLLAHVSLNVKTESRLSELVEFLDVLLYREPLMTVDSIRLREVGGRMEKQYVGDFVLKCYGLDRKALRKLGLSDTGEGPDT